MKTFMFSHLHVVPNHIIFLLHWNTVWKLATLKTQKGQKLQKKKQSSFLVNFSSEWHLKFQSVPHTKLFHNFRTFRIYCTMNFIDYFMILLYPFLETWKPQSHYFHNYIEKSSCFIKIHICNVLYCTWTWARKGDSIVIFSVVVKQ